MMYSRQSGEPCREVNEKFWPSAAAAPFLKRERERKREGKRAFFVFQLPN